MTNAINKMEIESSRYTYGLWIISFSLFFTTAVYLKWHSSFWSAFAYIIIIALFGYIFTGKVKLSWDNFVFSVLFAILFIWSSDMGRSSFAAVILTVLMPFVILIPWREREKCLDLFILKIFPFLIGVSIFFFITHLAGINLMPSFTIEPLNSLKPYNYTSYVFFVVPNGYISSIFDYYRFHSYYDEPGVVGTLMGAILFFYNKKLTPKVRAIYLIAGILSFSLFFFVALFAWLLFVVRRRFVKILLWIILSFMVVSIFVDNSVFVDNIWGRFRIEDGEWVGNNRNGTIFRDYFYDVFIHTDGFWTGTTDDADIASGSSSFEKLIFLKGFYYFAYGLIVYLLLFFRYKVSFFQFVIYFAMWFGLNYQRPSYNMFFLYIFFITVLQSQYYNEVNKKQRSKLWQSMMSK